MAFWVCRLWVIVYRHLVRLANSCNLTRKLSRLLFQKARQLATELGVDASSEAWCILQGVSPCQVRFNQPPISSVAPLAECMIRERFSVVRTATHEQYW
jgi:hypothetical protein